MTRKRKRAQDEAESKLVTNYTGIPFIHLELWEHIYRYLQWDDLWQFHFVASFFFHHIADFVARNTVLRQRFLVHYFTGDFFHRPCAPKWPRIIVFGTPQTEQSLAKAGKWLQDFNIKQITFKNQQPPHNSSFYKDKTIIAYLKNKSQCPDTNAVIFKGASAVRLHLIRDPNGYMDGMYPAVTLEPQTKLIYQIDVNGRHITLKDVEYAHLHLAATVYIRIVREQMDVTRPLSLDIVTRSIGYRVYIHTNFATPFHLKFSRRNRWCKLPGIVFIQNFGISPLGPTILSWKTPKFDKNDAKYETSFFRNAVCLEDVPVELYDDGHNRREYLRQARNS